MKNILVVDDSKTIRTICEWLYKGLDDTIVTADSIAQARRGIVEHKPSVIVLDYTMPDGDSYDFCKQLKAEPATKSIPVLFLGGKFAQVDEQKARDCGADDVLIKPFKSGDFLSKVDHLLKLAPSVEAEAAIDVDMSAGDVEHSTVPVMTAISRPSSKSGDTVPPPPSRRFNFPISGLAPAAAPESHATPPKPFGGVRKPDRETPQTPLPSVAPVGATAASIDPEILRAEIQAAVKEILPGVVRGVLKKLIVTEVTPQIQNWVDARVEALIKKMVK